MNLNGKTALVTGASKGIGKAIALELAAQGVFVGICYRQDEAGAEETLRMIIENGGYAKKFKCNVSDYKECALLMEQFVQSYGKIDILVNNAGISKVGLFIDMLEEDWDEIISTNLKGIFNTSHNAVKHMLFKKSGTIINISSIWGKVGAACEVIYSASKGGVDSFTKALAKELAPSNIRVNSIAPGVIETDMNSWLSEEEKKSLLDEIPMGCMGKTEDIAKLTAFLCSDRAKYITGQVIVVDGGLI